MNKSNSIAQTHAVQAVRYDRHRVSILVYHLCFCIICCSCCLVSVDILAFFGWHWRQQYIIRQWWDKASCCTATDCYHTCCVCVRTPRALLLAALHNVSYRDHADLRVIVTPHCNIAVDHIMYAGNTAAQSRHKQSCKTELPRNAAVLASVYTTAGALCNSPLATKAAFKFAAPLLLLVIA
jgi:hypothetical protein